MVPNSKRLNLSDFEPDHAPVKRSLLRGDSCSSPQGSTEPPVKPLPDCGRSDEKPTFIPVGFHRSHIDSLEKAVFGLRQQGYRKVSKSALIRILIENHLGQAVEEYKTRHTTV